MSRQAYIRASLILAATQHFPKSVQDALISNAKFKEEYALVTEAVVSFGEGISFQRSILFDAVRRSFDPGATDIAVNDTGGDVWRVEFLRGEVPPKIALTQGEKRLLVAHLALMSPDPDARLSVFRDEVSPVNLPAEAVSTWEALLEARPPDDDELGVIHDDLNDAPVVVRNAIREQLRSGSPSLDRLVPRSVRYYERLVGRFEGGLSFADYVGLVATPHMERLIKWHTFEGYQLALLLCSQPALSTALGTLEIGSDELARIFDWLAAKGDVISRTAAVEIGLSRLKSDPPLQDSLSRLVGAVALGEQPQPSERYKLLSSLIIVVYGELARIRVLASMPPFWRRMAAIAQAALIERCLIAVAGDTTEFADWAISARGQPFLLQCYVDLRLEPRWLPDLVLPDQLKNEFGGRMWMAASNSTEAVNNAGWGHLLLDDVEGSVRRQIKIPQAYWPGPLEGGSEPQMEIPAEHQAEMRADLSAPAISASSFSALVNGSLLFRIPADLTDTAADAIARADYRLDCGDDVKVLVPILLGLATVAAITRSHKLTDSLFTLLRKYRRFYADELGIEDSFRIGMIASASHVETSDWCQCVGNCMTDLAFQPIEQNEAARLHSHLVHLCHLVPELWATCGQAEAALRSVLNI